MNTTRIHQALRDIEENKLALMWLEDNGADFDGRNKEDATVTVNLKKASALTGAKEAQIVLSAFARLSLPALIETAKQNCRNTIEISENAIREEAASQQERVS